MQSPFPLLRHPLVQRALKPLIVDIPMHSFSVLAHTADTAISEVDMVLKTTNAAYGENRTSESKFRFECSDSRILSQIEDNDLCVFSSRLNPLSGILLYAVHI